MFEDKQLLDTEERRLFQRSLRKFLEKEVEPCCEKLDKEEILPYPLVKKLIEHIGFLPGSVSELEEMRKTQDAKMKTITITEIGRCCPSLGMAYGASVALFGNTILRYATDEQKEKYVLPVYRGEKIGCLGLTEPDAGSDVAGLRTKAEEDGDYYILSGSKTFITNAPHSDYFVIFAKTEPKLFHKGISAFILEKDAPGLSLGKPMEKMGMRGSPTGEIFLDKVRVPASCLLGEKNKGFRMVVETLREERSGISASCIGMIQRCLEESVKYAKQRTQFGQNIIMFQFVQEKLANIFTALEHTRAMTHRLLWMEEQGIDTFAEASSAKIYATEMATKCALDAIQVLGGYGYMKEYKVERFLRDAKLFEIGGGTTDIQKIIILTRKLMLEE